MSKRYGGRILRDWHRSALAVLASFPNGTGPLVGIQGKALPQWSIDDLVKMKLAVPAEPDAIGPRWIVSAVGRQALAEGQP